MRVLCGVLLCDVVNFLVSIGGLFRWWINADKWLAGNAG